MLLGQDGWPRVADFGLARVQTGPDGAPDRATIAALRQADPTKPPISNLTQTGVALGTPLYMSPEQHMGETVDSRSDQFSFCVALYEALYGKLPFAGHTIQSLYFNIISGKILPRPEDSHVPTILHQAILRGLAADPELRFPSMSELLAALSIDIARDASIGPGARREVAVSMLAVSLVALLGIKLPAWAGLGPQAASLATTAILFGFFTVMVLRFRRVIGKNWFHRGMLVYGFVVAGWMLALRGVGLVLGLGLAQIMTLDLLFIVAMTAVTTATILPRLWPMIPIAATGLVASLLEPRAAEILAPLVLLLGYVMSAFLWYRAALTGRPRPQPKQAAS